MKNIKNLACTIFAIASLTSCVEEDEIFNPDSSPNVIEIKNTGPSTIPSSDDNAIIPVFTNAFEIVSEVDFPVTISYSGAEVAPEDITVTLGVTESAIDTYNEWWNEDDDPEHLHDDEDQYELMPSTLYSFPSTTVTIPKGKREATFIIKVKTSQFDLNKSYGLPLTITNVSHGIISGNFGTTILAIQAKNKYDGIYSSVDGNVQRYTAPGVPTVGDALNGSMAGNADVTLTTIDANTVEITGLRWHGNASSIAGIDNLRATINPTTNEVTMTAVGNATLRNIPSTANTYDPDTKTFTLSFEWNPTSNRRAITGLVLKYKESR